MAWQGDTHHIENLLILLLQVVNLMLDESSVRAHAQVSWYSSTLTHIIPCTHIKPFLETFEVSFQSNSSDISLSSQEQVDRSKRGGYREAIRLALEDAKQASSIPLAVSGFSPSQSPREVMV